MEVQGLYLLSKRKTKEGLMRTSRKEGLSSFLVSTKQKPWVYSDRRRAWRYAALSKSIDKFLNE